MSGRDNSDADNVIAKLTVKIRTECLTYPCRYHFCSCCFIILLCFKKNQTNIYLFYSFLTVIVNQSASMFVRKSVQVTAGEWL
jgi:hypothetical protein